MGSLMSEHWSSLATLFYASGDQETSKYYRSLSEIEPIEVSESSDYPEARDGIELFKRAYEVKPKECYNNAFMLSMMDEDFEYVVGFYSSCNFPFPLGHAWNYHKPSGRYFDVTREEFLPEGFEYIEMKKVPASDVYDLLDMNDDIPPSFEDLLRLGYVTIMEDSNETSNNTQ